jgi:cell division protein FtsW
LIVIGISILFIGGMRLWYFIPVGVLGVAGSIAAYITMPHVRSRLKVFLDPFSASQGAGWQASQSLIAIGSGGLFGLGLGDSRQKFMYLPEPMNDFIFSVVCEELGFIGAALILIMFAYFVYRGYSIAFRAEDRFGCLMAVGITTHFAFQILLNLMVISGLFPVTGVSLPLFSYGGTALVLQLIEIGILLNISRHIPLSRKE